MDDGITEKQLFVQFVNQVISPYLLKVRELLKENNEDMYLWSLENLIPSALYVSKFHIAVEYSELSNITQNKVQIDREDLVEVSVLIQFEPEKEEVLDLMLHLGDEEDEINIRMPLVGAVDNLFVPLNNSLSTLINKGWNIQAQMEHQSTMLYMFGPTSMRFSVPQNEFASIRNSFFYNFDNNKKLITRHIKWVDIFPLHIEEDEDTYQIGFTIPHIDYLVANALNYEPPNLTKSQYDKLVILNRFIELLLSKPKETEITRFLSQTENQFIIKLYFSAIDIHSEVQLKWQSNITKSDIRPDYFVTLPNGFSDIVDFKLPFVKSSTIRGKNNRKRFSADLNEYIAQLREYRNYFDDPNNREYTEITKGIKVKKPRKYLIIGQRTDFEDSDWIDIQDDYKDLHLVTYTDLIETVTSAVYLIVD